MIYFKSTSSSLVVIKNCYYSSSKVTGLGFPVLSDWFLLYLDTSFGQIHPFARYLLCLDTSFGQISPLTRYLLWLGTSFGQIPPLARYILWLDTSSGNIYPPETYILQQHISSCNISLPAANLLRQHISSGNISPPATYLLQQHFVFTTALIQPSSFHSFRLTASQIVHPAIVRSWPISPSSSESWCATRLSLLHSLCYRVCTLV